MIEKSPPREVFDWLLQGLDDQTLTSSSPVSRAITIGPGPERARAIDALEHYDPRLATRTLQTANAVVFGLTRHIRNLPECIDVLGVDLTHALMTVTDALLAFEAVSPARISFTHFEAYSVRVGRLAHRFAGPEDAAAALMAATLLDIGKLVLATQRPTEFSLSLEVVLESHRAPHLVEAEVFGTSHATLGAELLARWHLPAAVVDLVRTHHEPLASPTRLAAAVRAADALLGIYACGDPASTFEEEAISACVGAETVESWRGMAEEDAARSTLVSVRGERLPGARAT